MLNYTNTKHMKWLQVQDYWVSSEGSQGLEILKVWSEQNHYAGVKMRYGFRVKYARVDWSTD